MSIATTTALSASFGVLALAAACDLVDSKPPGPLKLRTEAFEPGKPIPLEHTCKGDNTSPRMEWTEPPEGTESLALTMHDPDAPKGDWTHWVIFNIPQHTTGLQEEMPQAEQLTDGTLQGRNSFGLLGYFGPCPPDGPAHTYVFTLYALDTALELQPGIDRRALEEAMQGHIKSTASIKGTFKRPDTKVSPHFKD